MAWTSGTQVGHPQAGPSHSDDIALVVEGARSQDHGPEEMSLSWQRCVTEHQLDASGGSAPNILTQREIESRRGSFKAVLLNAQEEIDRLYAIVRQAGYVVLLCDTEGIVLHYRGNQTMAEQFKYWGLWLGGVWSEQIEGTNGIGTCVVERRPISVHRDQHFKSRHAGLSCAGAPVFDASCRLVAVLDCSSIDPRLSDHAHALTLAATITAAREIEERLFREAFHQSWIVAAAPCDDGSSALLVAVDRDRRIVGADRVARLAFSLGDDDVARVRRTATSSPGSRLNGTSPSNPVRRCTPRMASAGR
jgi:transcriptional regulator of acetoin/glycerol metabolism